MAYILLSQTRVVWMLRQNSLVTLKSVAENTTSRHCLGMAAGRRTIINLFVFYTCIFYPVECVNSTNSTEDEELERGLISWDDATWILTSAFIIFTMQSGFGMLEAGCVSSKNEVNIMMKNAVDVIFGGVSYWLYGYGLCFGDDPGSNPFSGWGSFAVDSSSPDEMGLLFSNFIFQLSFATTATTIVSGAMAERTKLSAYIVFSFLNTIVYCIPAHWIWGGNGFLVNMGCIDIAGSAGVHLVGAVSGLVATLILKPRIGRFDKGTAPPPMGNATNALVGMFMLWWGWLGFNCGSTFGISHGKWKLAARSAVTTLNASMGGGIVAIIFGYWWRGRKYDPADLVNGVLGALVSITAGCAVVKPWEALVIGAVGGILVMLSCDFFDKIKVDDPVGAVSVHGTCGIWGMLAVGLFVEDDGVMNLNNGHMGVFKGGGGYILGVQLLACVVVIVWSAVTSFLLLMALKFTIGLRLSREHEILGADAVEHHLPSRMQIEMEPLIENSNKEDKPKKPVFNCLRLNRRTSFGFSRSDVVPISGPSSCTIMSCEGEEIEIPAVLVQQGTTTQQQEPLNTIQGRVQGAEQNAWTTKEQPSLNIIQETGTSDQQNV